MSDNSADKKSFFTTLPGILSGCAALLTAIAGCVGVFYFGSKPPVPTPIPTTPSTVTITLTNNACLPQDFYIDGSMIVSSLPSGSTTTFQVSPGLHSNYACFPGTKNCGSSVSRDWETSLAYAINACPSQIKITFNNNNCPAQDIYLDNKLVAASLAQGATAEFTTDPGHHSNQACTAGTRNCGKIVPYDWVASADVPITCP